MFTLRIIFTGLIALGPMGPTDQALTETWAYFVEAPAHHTYLKTDCTATGHHCANVEQLPDGVEIQLYVDGNPVAPNYRLLFDYSFRNFVTEVSDVTGNSNPAHFNCNKATATQRPPGSGRTLPLKAGLKDPAGSMGGSESLLNSRMRIVGGGVWDDEDFTCPIAMPYCRGMLSALDVPSCRPWHFAPAGAANPPKNRCAHMANAVVYELQVETNDVDLHLVSLADGSDKGKIKLYPPNPSGTLEIWLTNAPSSEPSNMDHYAKLYGLFQSGIDKPLVPYENYDNTCKDSPGTWPIRCPVMQFQ